MGQYVFLLLKFMGPCIAKVFSSITNKIQFYTIYLISCFNLMRHLFIIFIAFLYMFRATLCSSSGGFIAYIQHLVLCVSLWKKLSDLVRI